MAGPETLDLRLAERRQETLDRFPHEAIAWLVLLPVWTDKLAVPAGFPAADLTVLLDQCEELGWCVRQQAVLGLAGREAAELLTDLAVRLRADEPGGTVTARITEAAKAATACLPSASRRSRIGARLADAPAGEPDPASPESDPGKLGVLGDLGALGDPAEATMVDEIAAGPDIGAAARVVAATARRLSPLAVLTHVSALMSRLKADPDESPVAAMYLAGAAVTAGDASLGLSISEAIPDPRVRVNALAEVAVRLADTGDRSAAVDVVTRVAATLGTREQVDLNCAADAAERVSTGHVHLDLGPILRKATDFPELQLGPQHIGSLLRIAAAARAAGLDRVADPLVERALGVAERQQDPAVQAAALVRLLPAVAGLSRHKLADSAWHATQEMEEPAQRARMLAALLPHLAAVGTGLDAADELIQLCGSPGKGTTFWTPDSSRGEVIEALGARHSADWLRSTAARIGDAVLAAPARHSIPAAALRWAGLARLLAGDATGELAGDKLLTKVDRALSSGATAEAGGWVLAGRRLLAVVRGTFETCLLLAVRRVELVNRRENDRRLLGSFLARREQLAAFDRLLGDDDGWALHYLGYGGVGKTMLLRHLCAQVAPARGWLAARIDFDHLNPEFPWQRPGQMLLELLEELEAHAPNDSSRRYFHEARAHLRQLEWWRGPAPEQRTKARAGLRRAVGKFCEYLNSLDQRVLIVLDTCEELAKFQPVKAVLPQLNAAFDLLEEVHANVPGVRVVLGGRRPLALAGAGGWRVDPSRVQAHLPLRKDYLAVHVVRGFSRDEATTYLSTVEKVVAEPEIIETVLERSVEGRHTPYLAGPAPDDVRYSPFDLALYAGLLHTDPEAVRSDDAATAYLNARLIDRLGPAAPLLPAVLAMRRFDYDMLAAAAVPANIPLDEVWPQFAGAEWVVSRLDAALPATFLEVDPGMLPRLTAFYREGQAAVAYQEAVRLLGPRLAALVRERRPDQLNVAHVEAALRCLPPADGAALCDGLALTVARGGSWMWAFTVCGRLLDTEGLLAEPGHPARAAALALYASATVHLKPGLDQTAVWADVAALAGRHPVPEIARWLRMRAQVMSGRVPGAVLAEATSLACSLIGSRDESDRARGSWLLGTVLLAAERWMDRLDALDERRPPGDEGLPEVTAAMDGAAAKLAAHGDGPGDRYVLAALRSRLHWFGGNPVAARTAMESALAGLAAGQVTASPYLAADRPGPINWRSRVRLRATALALAPPERGWLFAALTDDIAQIDSDRLAATVLRHWLDREPVPAEELERIEDALGDRRPPAAVSRLHHTAPPLRAMLARGWLALGAAHRARSALGPAGTFAESPREQAELDAMRIEIARRMRLTDTDRHLRKSSSRSADDRTGRAGRALEATALLDVDSRDAPAGGDPETLHQWWRSRTELPPPGPARDALRSGDLPGLALALDGVELALMTNADPNDPLDEVRRALPAEPVDEDQLRLRLRFLALAGGLRPGRDGLRLPLGALRERLGQRRIAEIALEEGELLALRLPVAARPLLNDAARWFLAAGDPVGRLIATTASLLAATHAGDEPTGTELLRLGKVYQAVAGRIRVLPRWEALPTASGSTADDPDWHGWLLRLRWLLAGPGGSLRNAVAHGQKAVPAELRPVARAATPSLARMSDAAYGTMNAIALTSEDVPVTWRRFLRPASPFEFIVLSTALLAGLAGLAAGGWALYAAVMWATGGVEPFGARIGVFAALCLALALGTQRFLTSGPRRSHASIDVEAGADAAGSTLVLTATGHRHRRWPLPAIWRRATATVPMPADPPYPGFSEVLRVVRDTADRSHLLPVELRVPPDLTRLDWEAALTEQAPTEQAPTRQASTGQASTGQAPTGQAPATRFQPWRGFDPLPVADAGELPRQLLSLARGPAPRAIRWAGPPQWAGLVRQASATTPAPLASLTELHRGDNAVLIASAVDSKGGRLLAVRLTGDRQVLLQPDDLRVRGVLLIVCGEPGWAGRRVAADRLGTRDLRECCADLMDAGAEAVVVVPSLPEHGLREALRLLTPVTGRGLGLLKRVSEVRDALRDTDRATGADITVMLHEL